MFYSSYHMSFLLGTINFTSVIIMILFARKQLSSLLVLPFSLPSFTMCVFSLLLWRNLFCGSFLFIFFCSVIYWWYIDVKMWSISWHDFEIHYYFCLLACFFFFNYWIQLLYTFYWVILNCSICLLIQSFWFP